MSALSRRKGRVFQAEIAKRWRDSGRSNETPEQRFARRVDTSGTCWEWTGGKSGGYGAFKFDGQQRGAHVVAWVIANGPIEDPNLFVCHHCDNRGCVRPSHLFLGTHSDNMCDMHSKGRAGRRTNYPRGVGCYNAKLTDAAVIEMRAQRAAGVSVSEVARRANVSRGTARSVLDGETWRHVA